MVLYGKLAVFWFEHFHTIFIWGGCRSHSPRRTRNTLWFSETCDTSAGSTKTGHSKVWNVVTPPGSWATSGHLGRCNEDAASRTFLAIISWDILVTWPNQNNWLRSLYLEKWLDIQDGFQSRTCRDVSNRELFTKFVSLPLELKIARFQFLPDIHDNRRGSEQRPLGNLTAFRCLKSPICIFRSIKLVQTCVFPTNLRINLSVPYSVSLKYQPSYMTFSTCCNLLALISI